LSDDITLIALKLEGSSVTRRL